MDTLYSSPHAPFATASTSRVGRMPPILDAPVIDLTGVEFPPYRLERRDATTYRILIALAGFAEHEVKVRQSGGHVVITGEASLLRSDAEVVHTSLAPSFRREFMLLNGFRLAGQRWQTGLLMLEVARDPAGVYALRPPISRRLAEAIALTRVAA
jgi:molecular chaperone IbpA